MKIFSLDLLAAMLAEARERCRIVLCHGCFDVIHVGHLKHFQSAKKMGDILVVTVTPDLLVNKGPNRPFLPHQLRMDAISAIGCVDYVSLNKWATAVKTIQLLRPHIYVKGPECRERQSEGLKAEIREVEAIGGEVAYTDDLLLSSTEILRKLGA